MEIMYVCVILVIVFAVFFIFRYKIHPPIIKIFGQRGEAFVSLYNGIERSGLYGIYKFTRNRKGKWKYEIEDKKYKVKQCAVSALVLPIVSLISSGFTDVLLILKISFLLAVIEAVVLLGVPYLLALESYIVLMRYLRKTQTKKVGSEVLKNNKKDKRSAKNGESEAQKNHKYEITERIIKVFVKLFVYGIWFAGLCILLLPFAVFALAFIGMLAEETFLVSVVFTGIGIMTIGAFLYEWISLRKSIMRDHSFCVPVIIAGKMHRYRPEKLLRRLKGNRNNVILLKYGQGQVRIYGNGDTHVLEVRIAKDEGLTFYHMTNNEDSDSIVPVTDNTPIVIENKWHEKFPIRKNWLVNNDAIEAFLAKLYTDHNSQIAMEGFSFENTTEEINRLIETDAYIVPEIPVDWPVGGINSNIGQAWMRRKEERLQRSLKLMGKL